MDILTLKNISKRYRIGEGFAVSNLDLSVSNGQIIALVGESGSGKTTLLRLIAGFEVPNSGEMTINGKLVNSPTKMVPPEKRGVGMVFQDGALFPHLSVADNIAFGMPGKGAGDRKQAIDSLLKLVGMSTLGARYPHELSGGQQQRVALARAMASEPSLILFDEPFSSLNRALKDQVRDQIKDIIKESEITAIFVTHDTKDALSIADRIAVMKEGQLLQIDTPENIYTKPDCCCIAGFFGKTNVLSARVTPEGYLTPLGLITVDHPNGYKGNVRLSIRPEHFEVVASGQHGINARIKKVTYCGDHKEVILAVTGSNPPGKQLHISVNSDHALREGQHIHVKPIAGKVQLLRDAATLHSIDTPAI